MATRVEAELREALEAVVASARPNPTDHPTMFTAWERARAALLRASGEPQQEPAGNIIWVRAQRDVAEERLAEERAKFAHLASAMRKMLPPALLAEVIAHLDPLTPFVEFLRASGEPAPAPSLSLSIQNDPLAISELLDDLKRQCEQAQGRYLDVVTALAAMWGVEVWRPDHAGLLQLIAERAASSVGEAPAPQPVEESCLCPNGHGQMARDDGPDVPGGPMKRSWTCAVCKIPRMWPDEPTNAERASVGGEPAAPRKFTVADVEAELSKPGYSIIRGWLLLHGGTSAKIVREEMAQLMSAALAGAPNANK